MAQPYRADRATPSAETRTFQVTLTLTAEDPSFADLERVAKIRGLSIESYLARAALQLLEQDLDELGDAQPVELRPEDFLA